MMKISERSKPYCPKIDKIHFRFRWVICCAPTILVKYHDENLGSEKLVGMNDFEVWLRGGREGSFQHTNVIRNVGQLVTE